MLDPDLRDRVHDYLAGLTPDQLSAVRGLQTRLAVLTESHTAPYLAPAADGSAIDLREALRGPEVVLFSLNSARYGRLAAQLGTLVVQDLVSGVGRSAGRREAGGAVAAATIAIDEFSALGADHLIALLARGRESGLSALVATQELADLDRAAAGLRDQVVGVTALKIIHRQEVPQSARTIALMVGTERVWEETRQTAGRLFGGYDTGRGTRRRSSASSCTRTRSSRSPPARRSSSPGLESRRCSGSGSSRRASSTLRVHRNRRVGPSRDGSNRRGRRIDHPRRSAGAACVSRRPRARLQVRARHHPRGDRQRTHWAGDRGPTTHTNPSGASPSASKQCTSSPAT